MEKINSSTRIEVNNAEKSHELGNSTMLSRIRGWVRKRTTLLGLMVFSAAGAQGLSGCVFDASGIGAPDAKVQSDRPLDDGSFDAGDSTVNPDADATIEPDAGDAQIEPDTGTDAQTPLENCANGIDDNNNGLTDCADIANCNGQPSTPGTVCGPDGQKHEANCGDGVNNDGDAQVDCADSDCNGQSCGAGCVCGGGIKTEVACGDGVDNDNDGNTDCMDSNCEGHECNNDPGCTCIGGLEQETDCADGIDNNGDGRADCQDERCRITEPSCTNVEYCYSPVDEDLDGKNNCFDPDCESECLDYTTTCTTAPGTGCNPGPGFSCPIGTCTEPWSDGFKHCVCENPDNP